MKRLVRDVITPVGDLSAFYRLSGLALFALSILHPSPSHSRLRSQNPRLLLTELPLSSAVGPLIWSTALPLNISLYPHRLLYSQFPCIRWWFHANVAHHPILAVVHGNAPRRSLHSSLWLWFSCIWIHPSLWVVNSTILLMICRRWKTCVLSRAPFAYHKQNLCFFWFF